MCKNNDMFFIKIDKNSHHLHTSIVSHPTMQSSRQPTIHPSIYSFIHSCIHPFIHLVNQYYYIVLTITPYNFMYMYILYSLHTTIRVQFTYRQVIIQKLCMYMFFANIQYVFINIHIVFTL